MEKIRKALLAALTLVAGGTYLAKPAAATGTTNNAFTCEDNVQGLCDTYCSGFKYCKVHWENRETCSFHIDGCGN